ncbi:MAG: nucleotidyltransferase domain-containing protein [Candidatus Nanohaloarchaea archaeon]|nr:nucleotidyltransferase domain-containing protein [Candidatus Nanohaloarchaea archaeon]
MVSEKGFGIARYLSERPREPPTINQISKALSIDYKSANTIVHRLVEEEVIALQTAGNSYLCSLNIESEICRAYLHMGEVIDAIRFMERNPEARFIAEDLKEKLLTLQGDILFACLYGSFAREENTKQSDLDVYLATQEHVDTGDIALKLEKTHGRTISINQTLEKDLADEIEMPLFAELVKDRRTFIGAEKFINKGLIEWMRKRKIS